MFSALGTPMRSSGMNGCLKETTFSMCWCVAGRRWICTGTINRLESPAGGNDVTEVLLGGVQRGIFGNPIGVQLKLDHFATPSRRTSRRIPPSSPRLNKMSLPSGDPGSEVEVQSQAKCVHVAWG